MIKKKKKDFLNFGKYKHNFYKNIINNLVFILKNIIILFF